MTYLAQAGLSTPRAVEIEVDGIPVSALISEADPPRAVILALHGGATTSAYFDAPDRPHLSLMRTSSALGFTVIALDRPGYGSSAGHEDKISSSEARVDHAYAALDLLLGSGARGAGVFVMAHSRGCELAVRMAADARGSNLLGIEISGTGRSYHARARAFGESRLRGRRQPGDAGLRLRDLLWEPAGLYPAGYVGSESISAPGPLYEGVEGQAWMDAFPRLAAQVPVPVQFSLGEHELWWESGPPALAAVAAMFTASPRVSVHEQTDGGHNLSLAWSARAYHLRVLSFVEECMLARENADRTNNEKG